MNKNRILIISIGGAKPPLIKSIQHHKPGYIYFFHSAASKKNTNEVIEEAFPNGFPGVKKCFQTDDENSINCCFNTCLKIFEDIDKSGLGNSEIIADPTGGTKIMSAALILAAADFNTIVSYVAGEQRNKDGLGTVVDGTEKIVRKFHPYYLIARREKEMLCHNFNSYRFAAAAINCEHLSKWPGNSAKTFVHLKSIAEGYADWDLFRHEATAHRLYKALKEIDKLSADHMSVSKLYDFIKQVRNHLEYLRQLPVKYGIEMAEELVANACRRAEEGHFDDAVARLYRAVEVIAQWRFIEIFGHDTSKFPLNKLDEKIRLKHFPRETSKEIIDIAMYKAFAILNDMEDEYGKKYMEADKKMMNLRDRRNQSILAHGPVPLDKDDFDRLYKIVREEFGLSGEKIKFPKLNLEHILELGSEEENDHAST